MEHIGDIIKNIVPPSSAPVSASRSVEEYVCSACRDSGWLHPLNEHGKPDYSRIVPCGCMEAELTEKKRQHLLGLCELPQGTEHMTLESFTATAGRLREAKEAAMQLGVEGKLKWLVLVGGVDRGKTHLAIAVCRERLKRGTPARYAYVPLLLDELRRGFSGDGNDSYEKRFEFFCDVPLLVLDDLGVEKSSEWVQEKLDTIVDYRYIRGLPLVVTTNKPMNELPFRIASRLQRYNPGRIVVIDAPEHRLRRSV